MDLPGHLPAVARSLHLHLSMAGFLVVLFFAVTGLTLNHPQWFAGGARTTQYRSTLDPEWTNTAASTDVAKLEIVEYLRMAHGVRGEVKDFRVDDTQCVVSFGAPGYSADAVIDRKTSNYELTVSRRGLVALVQDLHTGRGSGPVWPLVIDLSAAVLTIGALTGLVLTSVLHQHRLAGLAVLAAGGTIGWLIYAIWVP